MGRGNISRVIKLFATLALLCCLSGLVLAQRSTQTSRKLAVEGFLTQWLIQKDIPAAMRFFDKRAFRHREILLCDNDEGNEHNPKAVKSKINDLLREGSNNIKGKTLNELLLLGNAEDTALSSWAARHGDNEMLNSPDQDKYYLLSLTKFMREDGPVIKLFRRRFNLKGAFVSVMQFKQSIQNGESYDAIFFLFWIRHKNTWKVVTFGDACD